MNNNKAVLPEAIKRQCQHSLKKPLLILSSALLMASQPALAAEQQDNIIKMDTIVVVDKIPNGVDSVISQDDLENIQANDLSDVLRGDPSISAGGSVQMSQKIYLRNVGEDQLNITVDGAEQAGAVFHHAGRVAIEPELLKQVDVEAGAGNATSGPGALGGSVRFTTKDPEDLLQAGEKAGALVKAGYYGNGSGNKLSTTFFASDDEGDMSAMLSLSHANLGNLDDADGGEIAGTETEKTLGYGKLVFNLTEEQYLSLSYERVNEEGDILYKPDLITSRRNVAEPTDGQRGTAILNYNYSSESNNKIDLGLNLYHTKLMQDREFRGTSYRGTVETIGFTLQNKSIFSQHQLDYGVNYRSDKSRLKDVDIAPYYFEETGEVKGIFIQDIITLNEQVTLSVGTRFDDYQLDDVNEQDINDQGWSSNLGLRYQLNETLAFHAAYAEALRGAEIKDSFKLSSSSNDAQLQAESSENIELGLDYSKDNLNLAFGLYSTVIENVIGGLVPWSKVYENLDGDIKTKGFYAKAGYSWQDLSINAGVNIADSKMNDETVTRYVHSSGANSIGDTFVLDAQYVLSEPLLLGWSAEFVKSIDDINLMVGEDAINTNKAGYAVHDMYLRWLTSDLLTLNLSIKNVFDKQYLSHASVEDFSHNAGWEGIVGSPEAGRDIRLSLSARF